MAPAKESSCQCRRCKGRKFSPCVSKSPWRRKWQPTPVFLPGKFNRQKCLVGYSPWSHKELDIPERLMHVHGWATNTDGPHAWTRHLEGPITFKHLLLAFQSEMCGTAASVTCESSWDESQSPYLLGPPACDHVTSIPRSATPTVKLQEPCIPSMCMLCAQSFGRARFPATPWSVASQAPLCVRFSRQERWSGLPCPPLENLPNPGIEPASPALQADSLPLSHLQSPVLFMGLAKIPVRISPWLLNRRV